eukprot:1153345-Pelagomonas_calceolata.AAC.1
MHAGVGCIAAVRGCCGPEWAHLGVLSQPTHHCAGTDTCGQAGSPDSIGRSYRCLRECSSPRSYRRVWADWYEERRCSLPLLPCYTADTEGSIEGKILGDQAL